MRIALLGANGQLGTDLKEAFESEGWDVIPCTQPVLSVENESSVRAILSAIRPDIVVNAAAYVDVPKCEERAEYAFAVNAVGALNVARVSAELGCRNVYFSTDYVFDGAKRTPYVESDVPHPINIYGLSKLAGEFATMNYSANSLVVRISGIYGKVPSVVKGVNFITSIVRQAREKSEVRVVNDEFLTPTPTREIAEKTSYLVRVGASDVFHVTSEGECSWFEFAQEVFRELNISTPLIPVSARDFPTNVRRPVYSVLENKRLNALPGAPKMAHWKDALKRFLNENTIEP